MAAKRKTRRVGRPPAGEDGARVTDYPQLGLRIPAEAKAKLQALSVVSSLPQWRLLSDAIERYLLARPEQEQREVQQLVARSARRRTAASRARAIR